MENHNCKVCLRSFSTGKALDGHMRSHMEKNSPPNKDVEVQKDRSSDVGSESVYFSSSSDDETDDQRAGKKRAVPVESESETETESESSKLNLNNPAFKRSKRVPRVKVDGLFQVESSPKPEGKSKINEHSPLSSISENNPDADVARLLIQMSRDKWPTEVEEKEVEEKEVDVEEDGEEDDFFSEDSDFGKVVKSSSNKVRGKYKCDTCNRLFKSYQALGGHRTSHKKSKVVGNAALASGSQAAVADKVYECPYCDRVFSSGQAFGGHKRSHFVGRGGAAACEGRDLPVGGGLELDLNQPALDDDDEVSNSAVSDTEFFGEK